MKQKESRTGTWGANKMMRKNRKRNKGREEVSLFNRKSCCGRVAAIEDIQTTPRNVSARWHLGLTSFITLLLFLIKVTLQWDLYNSIASDAPNVKSNHFLTFIFLYFFECNDQKYKSCDIICFPCSTERKYKLFVQSSTDSETDL